MSFENYANAPQTTLSANLTLAGTSLSVSGFSGFPASGRFRILIDSEIMIVTAGNGTTTWTVTRGAENTAQVAHTSSTTVYHVWTAASFLNAHWYDVRSYGAVGDGSTDDSTPIQNAINDAHAAGGGAVFFSGNGTTYVASGLTIYGNIRYFANANEGVVLKLKSGSNTFLMQTSNFATLTGTNSTGGESNFIIENLTLDGNKSGNGSATVPVLRIYGFGYRLQNVVVRSGNNIGLYTEWSNSLPTPGADSMMSHWSSVKVHDCGSHGVHFKGPHDSQWINGEVFLNAAKGIFVDSHGDGLLATNVHSWGLTQTHSWYLNATGIGLVNCVAEGASTANLVFDGNDCWADSVFVYGAGASAPVGIVIGSVNTPTSCKFRAKILNCTSGGIDLTHDGGGAYDATLFQSSGSALISTPHAQSSLILNANGVSGSLARFVGPVSPGSLNLGNSAQAGQLFMGSGVPGNGNGNNGDFYFRTDGTVAGHTVLYHKESGSWVATGA